MRKLMTTLAVAVSLQAAEVIHLRNEGADAFFTSFSGCVVTTYQISANAENAQAPRSSPAAPQSVVNAAISRYDICTQTAVAFATGTAPLSASEFQIDQTLNSASLNVTVAMQDGISGQTFTAQVALTWSATDSISQGTSVFHSSSPGMRMNGRTHGWFRTAVASGRIVIGGAETLLDPALYASLRRSASGMITIN
jgi:hypothetical protein